MREVSRINGLLPSCPTEISFSPSAFTSAFCPSLILGSSFSGIYILMKTLLKSAAIRIGAPGITTSP
ncbi:MAG TPA: hypothetical protein PK683_21585, partial [Leptospiraceae bacterium]|nr:hypothetical protein [Leptospiraceae bacterium]